MLPLAHSLFIPLFYLMPFQNKTVEAAAAPMVFYWGLGIGWEKIVCTSIF
jgi:hypothetical protein